jgi:NAD(P)-dependent dehydrogenase (short-subunit alcohol dehydrogenase family)
MSNWTGRVCVITGAGSGIGAGLARQALSRGMQVICADITLRACSIRPLGRALRLHSGRLKATAGCPAYTPQCLSLLSSLK